jgi:hypothetical protein
LSKILVSVIENLIGAKRKMPSQFSLALSIVAAAIAVAAGVRWAVAEWQAPSAKSPIMGINGRTYRFMERARRRFFHGNRSVRFTIFRQDPNDHTRLQPMARLGPGNSAVDSKATFKLGEGLAGRAWTDNRLQMLIYSPTTSISDFREAQQKLLGLSAETASVLSVEQLTKVRGMVAIPIHVGTVVKGVVCIDVFDEQLLPDPVHKNRIFWFDLFQFADQLASRIDFGSEIQVGEARHEGGLSLCELNAA